jgi:ribosomal protein L11 methyltransferase
MEYKALNFKLEGITDTTREIIIARLYDIGFEGFLETDDGVVAYIPAEVYKKINPEEIKFHNNPLHNKITIEEKFIIEKNWNELWEKSYKPVIIGDQCIIKTSFHKNTPKLKYEILIDPKMSFGTGHHETTALMIKEILEIDFKGKNVLDIGCGTGILAILASKKEAENITAIDINDWAYRNTIDNLKKNNVNNAEVYKGDVSLITGKTYDIILANIQLNVILNDIMFYELSLNKKGLLMISGIYKENNNWVSVKFKKI